MSSTVRRCLFLLKVSGTAGIFREGRTASYLAIFRGTQWTPCHIGLLWNVEHDQPLKLVQWSVRALSVPSTSFSSLLHLSGPSCGDLQSVAQTCGSFSHSTQRHQAGHCCLLLLLLLGLGQLGLGLPVQQRQQQGASQQASSSSHPPSGPGSSRRPLCGMSPSLCPSTLSSCQAAQYLKANLLKMNKSMGQFHFDPACPVHSSHHHVGQLDSRLLGRGMAGLRCFSQLLQTTPPVPMASTMAPLEPLLLSMEEDVRTLLCYARCLPPEPPSPAPLVPTTCPPHDSPQFFLDVGHSLRDLYAAVCQWELACSSW